MREPVYLVYDKQCPACDNYCQVVRIQESIGDLVLVNARQNSPIMDEITQQGLDIDQGMVLKVGDQLYHGADAIHALSLMSSRSGIFNRLNYWMFASQDIARVLYPILKCLRNALLKLLRKSKINNLGVPNNTQF